MVELILGEYRRGVWPYAPTELVIIRVAANSAAYSEERDFDVYDYAALIVPTRAQLIQFPEPKGD